MNSPANRVVADADLQPSRKTGASTRSRRSQFLKWLRKIHGWIGLWGAVLGLLFGVTGFLQNHRAVMKLRVGAPPVVSSVHMPVAADAFHSPREMAAWMRTQLKLDRDPARMSREPAKAVTWSDQTVTQPERWNVRFIAPHFSVDGEYYKGGTFVQVERRDQGVIAVLEALHRSQGASVGWILLADSIAGSMVLLSLTGVILWTELNRKRTLGATIFIASLFAMLCLGIGSL